MSVQYQTLRERKQRRVTTAAFHNWKMPDGSLWTSFYRCDGGYLLRFPGLADFEVSGDGASVQGWPVPGVAVHTVEHLHLNQVLPLALSRQGQLVLCPRLRQSADISRAGRGCLGLHRSRLRPHPYAKSMTVSGSWEGNRLGQRVPTTTPDCRGLRHQRQLWAAHVDAELPCEMAADSVVRSCDLNWTCPGFVPVF